MQLFQQGAACGALLLFAASAGVSLADAGFLLPSRPAFCFLEA
jgi:hypothetical protein